MKPQLGGWPRTLVVLVLIAGTALFLRSRSQAETNPPSNPLTTFPLEIGDWKGKDIAIPQWALDVLGDGQFVERNFRRNPDELPVDFFLAYFPSQRMGSTIHSPQNCLPGSGWVPLESTRVDLPKPGGGTIHVNRYVLTKGFDRMLVIYWYATHGRVIASEYWAKFYLVADAIHLNRSDGALVRFMTPMAQNETVDSAQQRSVALVEAVWPILNQYVPN